MSDIMKSIPFPQLLTWIREEYRDKGSVFGVHTPFTAQEEKALTLFDRKLEVPLGPAAGPNSQLAQNIAAAYFAGARFFELKTVQIMDGAELAACVNKPCIKADDEGYNCEWSTELTVPQAQEEYIKAWFLLSFMAKEYGLGGMDGFQFNLSVGYDLAGIQSEKINHFIDSMMDASADPTFQACRQYLIDHVDEFENVTLEDIESISPLIANSATISTLHGCPPQEIESIARHLLTQKHIHTLVKCNPTLLGYDFARSALDSMGYDYIRFGRFHFEDDLQYADAVPMLKRLMALADELGLSFGVKLTNTFPVDVKAGELPSEEMYMSGRSLYPLSISLASELSCDLEGRLRISYSGGADAFNIAKIASCGVWPVTVATTILKPGGYQRLFQMASELEAADIRNFTRVDTAALSMLAGEALCDSHHLKSAKGEVPAKSPDHVPLLDCFTAPCRNTCPIRQEIPTYIALAGEEKYKEALKVILNRNALPFITGTICSHPCQGSCTRNYYEQSVQIRDTKLLCAKQAFDEVMESIAPTGSIDKKVAIVGGGPAGMAAAFYLARLGAGVCLYEKSSRLGGVVSSVIPDFRIDDSVISKDAALLEKLGVDIHLETEAPALTDLEKEYDAVILAVGAYKRSHLDIEGGSVRNALDFLEEFNRCKGQVDLGKHVVVIGGGNTAMDTARAARRCKGDPEVALVYRRTKRYMPADEHELLLAEEDGVEFMELLAPERYENGELICSCMQLGQPDSSGRASVSPTGETVRIPADTIIAATGEKVPTDFFTANGLETDASGRAIVSSCLESSRKGVYVIGDARTGPSIVVKGMADAIKACEAILGREISGISTILQDPASIIAKKGILAEAGDAPEAARCLACSTICENCVDVCPNRANISIRTPDMPAAQVIHVDYMCNECGNCRTFCPYSSAPYLDKFTLFASEADMDDSKNSGFTVLDPEALRCRIRLDGENFYWQKGQDTTVPRGLLRVIEAVVSNYPYLLG